MQNTIDILEAFFGAALMDLLNYFGEDSWRVFAWAFAAVALSVFLLVRQKNNEPLSDYENFSPLMKFLLRYVFKRTGEAMRHEKKRIRKLIEEERESLRILIEKNIEQKKEQKGISKTVQKGREYLKNYPGDSMAAIYYCQDVQSESNMISLLHSYANMITKSKRHIAFLKEKLRDVERTAVGEF